jgi:DNA-binding Xre family transcriptional regulator
MRWNLRLAAANRGIWTASQLQRLLAARGLVISAGKMSGLWSGHPASLKLSDLDVICAVLDCGVAELLIPEPDTVPHTDHDERGAQAATGTGTSAGAGAPGEGPRVRPRRRGERTLPPTP